MHDTRPRDGTDTPGPVPATPPRIDAETIARLYSVQAGGLWGNAAERNAAAEADVRWPGTADQVRAARRFHAVAAAQAVTAGARGLLIGAAGYPCEPHPHRAALDAEPLARAVLCDPSAMVTLLNRALLGSDPRVSTCEATVRDPAVLLGLPEVAALPRPLFVLLPLVAQFWPPAFAASVLREWGALLPAGSVTAVSLWIPDGTRAGDEFAEWFAGCGARMFGHSPADVAGWLEGAGMVIAAPGVRDVRGWTGPARSEAHYARRRPGRVIEAVARVP
jgi:hypothetical protein